MQTKRDLFHSRVRLVSLLVLVTTFPFSLHFAKVANNIAIIALCVNWLFESSFSIKIQNIKQRPLLLCFVSFYLLHVVALAYTENFHQGFFELEKKLSILLFPMVFSTSLPLSKNEVRAILKWFIFSCTTATVVCVVYALYRNYHEGYTLSYVYNGVFHNIHGDGKYEYINYWYFTYHLFSSPLEMHPVYLSMYILFSSCLMVWLWWDKTGSSKMKRTALILFLLYNFFMIILLSSRTQLFASLILGTAFILYQSHLRKKIVSGIIFISIVYVSGFILIFMNPISRERIFESNNPGSHYSENKYGEGGLSLRTYKWKYALEAIAQNPIVGTAPGDAQDQLQLIYQKNDFKIGYENHFNPHNQFFQSALELGLLGLISLIACLAMPGYLSYKTRNFLFLIFILLFAISCTTESMLEVNKGIVFYAFFNSLFSFHFNEERLQGT